MADVYDEIFNQVSGQSLQADGQKQEDPYDKIFNELMPKQEAAVPQIAAPKSSWTDIPNAIGTGFSKGLVNLAGLPVDTAANLLDLGKAAIGAPYIAATGKAPPNWLEVQDRKNTFGSSAYFADKLGNTALGSILTKASNPEFENGYLQNAGSALTGVINPGSRAQAFNQAINSILGATAGKAVGDATGNTALAIAAGMSPTALKSGAINAVKYGVRGGEEGRKAMAQRVFDLKSAGVENPTLGLASGNSLLGGVENILQSTPGAINIMSKARGDALAGLKSKTENAANLASPNLGSLESGMSIQSGLKDFKNRFKATQGGLYDRLDKVIPSQTPVNVAQTRDTLAALNADIPTMPELSKQFINGRIQSIESALNKDLAGTPAIPAKSIPSIILNPAGQPANTTIVPGVPATLDRNAPWTAVKKTRTLVGNEIADTNIASSVPRSKWNPLYGALSKDMEAAASQYGATDVFNRANNYTRSGLARLDRVEPFTRPSSPEKSFEMLNRTLRDNTSTLQAVKKSLPEGARGDFAGTVIDNLGMAKAGQQNAAGTAWSPETFLTNWNNMKPTARNEMLSGFPNSKQVAKDIENVAQATSMMRDSSKMWANPSGTAANSAARGLLASIGVGGTAGALGMLNPVIPAMAAGGVLSANQLAKAMTNKRVRESMMRDSQIDSPLLNSQIIQLFSGGLLDKTQ